MDHKQASANLPPTFSLHQISRLNFKENNWWCQLLPISNRRLGCINV